MIAEILNSFKMNIDYARRLLVDIPEEQMTAQPTDGMNHPAWILGHLTGSFQLIGGEMGVKPWLSQQWLASFQTGSTPAASDSSYPGKDDLVQAFEDAQARLTAALANMESEDLDEPLPDARYRHVFPTLGSAVLHILTTHTAVHLGQLSAWRRAMGLPAVADPH